MARDAGYRHCGVDGWLAEKVQTQLGILAVPLEQRALDRLGLGRSRLRADCAAALSCLSKHPRRLEESEPARKARLRTSQSRAVASTVRRRLLMRLPILYL